MEQRVEIRGSKHLHFCLLKVDMQVDVVGRPVGHQVQVEHLRLVLAM
jgi:hypothetical protein